MTPESLPLSAELPRPRTGMRRIAAVLLAVAGAAYLVCNATPLGFAQGALRPSMPSALTTAVEPPRSKLDVYMQFFGNAPKKTGAKKPVKKPVAKKPVKKPVAKKPVKKPVAKKGQAPKTAAGWFSSALATSGKAPVVKAGTKKPVNKGAGGRNQENPLVGNTFDILSGFFFKPRDEMRGSLTKEKNPRR